MLKQALEYLILMGIGMTIPSTPPPAGERPRAVKGSSLSERLDRAVGQSGTDAPRTPFWTAYTFDARLGVALDPVLAQEFDGRIEGFAGTEVFFGTFGGAPAVTRNVAIFARHKRQSKTVERVEIRNLDKERRPDGLPVYWLGRASGEDSLSYLRQLVESGLSGEIGVRGALAIAAHDDPRVGETLKNFARESPDERVRDAAVDLLGQVGAEREFLADLVRHAAHTRTRVRAVRSLGLGRDHDTLVTLQGLFQSDPVRQVKTALLDALASNDEREAVAVFLLGIAGADPDPAVRQHAVYTLRNFGSDATVEELMRIYHAAPGESPKQQVLYTFSRMRSRRALEKLFEVARGSDNPRLRIQARHFLNEKVGKRFAGARGEGGDTDASKAFAKEAERILSERPKGEAVTLLINTAKTHPDAKVRATASRLLSRIDDPLVLDFFRELLSR